MPAYDTDSEASIARSVAHVDSTGRDSDRVTHCWNIAEQTAVVIEAGSVKEWARTDTTLHTAVQGAGA
jgi:hypothetical protein